jgi:urease accessory protein
MAIRTGIRITSTRMAEAALFDLLSWMSPAWPIGAFAHSGGLEWAVEDGLVTGRASCARWLGDLLEHGAIRNDAVLFVHAWRAAKAGDETRLAEVADLALASQAGFERRLESTAQGAAFSKIANATVPPRNGEGDHAQHDGGDGASGTSFWISRPAARSLHHPAGSPPPRSGKELAYPVAAASLFADQNIALIPALTAYLHGAIANLVSAAQRLVPLGQTDGQRVLRDLRAAVLETAETLAALPDGDLFDQLGGCTLLAELGCMAHETQYTRLFRT